MELHRRRILEPVAPHRRQVAVGGRDDAPSHQREGVVDEPRVEPGHQAAGEDDDEDEDDSEEGGGDSLDVPPGPRGDEFVCTLHGWRFDLATGTCRNAADHHLRVRRADRDTAGTAAD